MHSVCYLIYRTRTCVQSILLITLENTTKTTAVAQWLERSPREREVVGWIPDRVIPKTS